MGSLMLFKDSWTIKSFNNDQIVLNGTANLLAGDWLYSGDNVYKVVLCQYN
jgi:hypothetical protein